MKSSRKNLFLDSNEEHQLILKIHQHIFHSKWIWIGFLGGHHEVCLAAKSLPSSLPYHLKRQWDTIENYLDSYHKGHHINPEKSLQEIVDIGVKASRQKEKPRRHPTTDSYYLIFNEYVIKDELTILKKAFVISHKEKIPSKK